MKFQAVEEPLKKAYEATKADASDIMMKNKL